MCSFLSYFYWFISCCTITMVSVLLCCIAQLVLHLCTCYCEVIKEDNAKNYLDKRPATIVKNNSHCESNKFFHKFSEITWEKTTNFLYLSCNQLKRFVRWDIKNSWKYRSDQFVVKKAFHYLLHIVVEFQVSVSYLKQAEVTYNLGGIVILL